MATIDGGVRITGFISPTDTQDTYAVIDPVYGVDSLRNVNDITARNEIPSERRRAGMIVGVKNGAFNDYYVLNSGNTTWSQIQMVTGLTWDLGSYDLTLNTFGGGITKNLSSLASDVTVTGGTYNSLNGIVTFSSSTTNTRTGLFYAGNWNASSAYTASTVVTYTVNNLDYYSIANVSANPTPPSGDTANWRPISSRGVFIVTGFTAGYTNIYTTAATYNQTGASIALDFTDPSKNLSITGITTLYGKDDSIKSDRRVDLNQKTLNFSSSTAPNSLTISTGGTVGIGVLSASTKLHISAATDPIRIEGIGGSSDSNVLTIDNVGVVHSISVASLTSTVASSINTLYTSDGALNGNRVVDLNQKTLNFSSSTIPNALTVSTGGTVGIGVLSGTNTLHVTATTNPVRFQGLAGISADTYLTSVDTNGVLRAFSATTGRIPFFSSNQITTNADFTYSQGASGTGTLFLPSSFPAINFGTSRAVIYSPAAPLGLYFETSYNAGGGGLSNQYPDPSKMFVFRNKPYNNDLVMSHLDRPNSKFLNSNGVLTFSAPVAAFGGQVVINETSTVGPPNPIRSFWGTAGSALNIKSAVYTEANSTATPATRSEIVANSFNIPTFSANTTLITSTQNYTTLSSYLMYYSAATTGGTVLSITINDSLLSNFYNASLFALPSLSTSSAGTASSLGEILSATSTGYRGVSYSQIVAQTGLTDPGFFTGITTGSTTYYTGVTSGVTYSALSNVYIAGAPIKGSNVSGDTYALKVQTGTTYFGGDVTLSSISSAATATQVLTRESNGNVSFKNINDIGGGNLTADTFVTGFTLSSNTITLTQNRTDGYSAFTISLSAYTGSSSASGAYLPLSGGTVSGGTVFTSGLTANTLTLSGISSGTTAPQLLTRESNGSVSFKSITDITGGNVLGNIGATLYWYDENNTPPAVIPVATGTGSIAFGNGAKALASSMFVFGLSAGTSATNASGSTFIGDRSGFGATFADNSLFIGDQAGYQSSNANNSTFIGVGAGSNASSASNSTFIGTQSGLGGTSANNSIMIGSQAGYGATSANNSQFFGVSAGKGATGATYSFFAGSGAGWSASSVTSSAFIGKNAGSGATNASYSLFIGEDAGKNATSASGSTFIGRSAGDNSTNLTGKSEYSIAIGYEALKSSSNNDKGVYIGYQAGQSSVNSTSSVIIGNGTARGITGSTSLNGVYIGTSAGELAHTSSGSVFIGTNAGVGANGSSTAVMIGSNAGNAGDIAPNAVMIGADAGKNSTGADRGIFIGSNSGEGVTGTTNGIFIGNLAGSGVGTSDNMIAIGVNAGLNVKTAASTIIIGPSAGSGTTSNSSIIIGSKAASSGGFGNNNIIIGTNITLSSGTVNSFNIGGVLFGTGCNSNDVSSSIFTAITGSAVSIGINKPNSSAILDLTSTSKGFLPPRVGSGDLPSSPAKGLIVHSDASGSTPTRRYAGLQLYDGTMWRTINPYKRYVAAVDIDSGNNMTAGYPIVLENELNTTIGVVYDRSVKVITISASTGTPFTTDKTAIFATCGVSKGGGDITVATYGFMFTNFVDSSKIQVAKATSDRVFGDTYYTVIEIRVYD